MSKPLTLELSPDDLHTLAISAETKRGTHVRIPKALIKKMMVDHTRLVQYAKSQGALGPGY